MFYLKQFRRVVHRAVSVVVIAHRAIEQMIAENAIKRVVLGCLRPRRRSDNVHSLRGDCSAGSYQLAIYLNHAGIARLDNSQLRVIADLWNACAAAVDYVDEARSRLDRFWLAVDSHCHAVVHLFRTDPAWTSLRLSRKAFLWR